MSSTVENNNKIHAEPNAIAFHGIAKEEMIPDQSGKCTLVVAGYALSVFAGLAYVGKQAYDQLICNLSYIGAVNQENCQSNAYAYTAPLGTLGVLLAFAGITKLEKLVLNHILKLEKSRSVQLEKALVYHTKETVSEWNDQAYKDMLKSVIEKLNCPKQEQKKTIVGTITFQQKMNACFKSAIISKIRASLPVATQKSDEEVFNYGMAKAGFYRQ